MPQLILHQNYCSCIIVPYNRALINMEVIHRFKGFYPFQLQVQSQHTYLQVLKQDLSQLQISIYRKRYKTLKSADQTNLVKLVKIYKEQSKLHLLYEYYPLSLEKYIQDRCQKCSDSHRDQYKFIYGQFVAVMSSIIDHFIKFNVKTDIIIQNFVISDIQKGQIKLFVDPDAEFLGLKLQNQTDQKQINVNRIFLQEYYLAEKKRIIMEFEQLLQNYFGINQICEVNRPNFIINGSKLVFINGNQPKNNDKQRRNEIFPQKICSKIQNKRSNQSGSPVKTQISQMNHNLKEKTLKKLSETKSVMNRIEAKPLQINTHDDCKYYPETEDDIIFRPQQITNDKTALLEQNEYPQSLQNEIQKISKTQKRKQDRQSAQKRADLINQINQIQEKNKRYKELVVKDVKGFQKCDRIQENKSIDRFKDLKNSKNDCNSTNNDKSANSGESQQTVVHQQEKKQQKSNRYKMKITTSHQIQIQGSGQTQIRTTQKDIIQGIKSGKLSISEQTQRPQRPKTVKLQTQQPNCYQEKKAKKLIEDIQINSRNSDTASKNKKINQIIQKINSKSNINNQFSNSSHHSQQKQENFQTLCSYKSNIETIQHQQQNYYDKIKSAKNKAQQVLKQYARKKL